jgi:predicted RNase H-like nuclease (RuvC/YqgF family)
VQRDESLRQRDEVLVALERRVQDLAEKTGNYETLKASYSKLLEESEEVTGKYARLSEEHRRLRSKNERKTATLTREMGEWVRKVDHLRQGLQKFNQNIVRPEFSEEAESDSDTPPTA